MMVLCAANSNPLMYYLAGRYEGKIGWMVSPATGFFPPKRWLPYAIDNGKYSAYANKSEWDEDGFFDMLDRYRLSRHQPMWVAVPDEVGNKDKTLWLWNQYEPKLRKYKWDLAFVAQDGMIPANVPESADLVFIGGTTEWKWRNAALFNASCPRVHIGRAGDSKLDYCDGLGVESVDSSGFFREGDGERSVGLQEFLAGKRMEQHSPELF